MHLESNRYTFMFAFAVCVTCSLALSIVSEGLKEKKDLNVALDVKKNILKAVRLQTPLPAKARAQEVLDMYDMKIQEKVIDAQGQIVEGKRPGDIEEGEARYSMYVYKEGGGTVAYCFPIVGKGLWSTIYGYFALEADVMTVRGVTFYKHGETPGLGAEIEKDWFQDNYKGKKIWDVKGQKLVPIKVVKGKVANVVPKAEVPFNVDGISGATMTSKGITAMVDRWVRVYEPFFKTIRKVK
ncbi:MAG: NADH:ubiquinone reductase (Na(+)-transporting) subunit C [Candidatus Omnitrophica bacterium]|nr:NADH:ubiquinone reductase (Na(+)-transporting) subunit C [Candidatus Omnitrophota bacterium]